PISKTSPPAKKWKAQETVTLLQSRLRLWIWKMLRTKSRHQKSRPEKKNLLPNRRSRPKKDGQNFVRRQIQPRSSREPSARSAEGQIDSAAAVVVVRCVDAATSSANLSRPSVSFSKKVRRSWFQWPRKARASPATSRCPDASSCTCLLSIT